MDAPSQKRSRAEAQSPPLDERDEETWVSLVSELPTDMKGIDNLVKKLSEEAPFSAFCPMSEQVKLSILKENQGTLLDQVHNYELAPSTQLEDLQVMEIIRNIFHLEGIYDYRGILAYLTSKRQDHVKEQAEPSHIQEVEISSFTVSISEHRCMTLGFTSKEASGYAMLSNFSLFVCKLMGVKYPSLNFCIEPQFIVCDGKKNSSDQTLVQLLMGSTHMRVLVVWEYKPRVACDIYDVPAWHLSETLLQAYYMRRNHCYPVLHCLTDLNDYHYFFIEDGPTDITLSKYVYMHSDLSVPKDAFDHINFLLQSVPVQR